MKYYKDYEDYCADNEYVSACCGAEYGFRVYGGTVVDDVYVCESCGEDCQIERESDYRANQYAQRFDAWREEEKMK